MARDPQSKYTPARPNDVLSDLVDQFEKGWKQRRQPITAGEITAVTNAITTILQN
jgi:hypothetical protein